MSSNSGDNRAAYDAEKAHQELARSIFADVQGEVIFPDDDDDDDDSQNLIRLVESADPETMKKQEELRHYWITNVGNTYFWADGSILLETSLKGVEAINLIYNTLSEELDRRSEAAQDWMTASWEDFMDTEYYN